MSGNPKVNRKAKLSKIKTAQNNLINQFLAFSEKYILYNNTQSSEAKFKSFDKPTISSIARVRRLGKTLKSSRFARVAKLTKSLRPLALKLYRENYAVPFLARK